MMSFIRRLYDWTLRLSAHPRAKTWLAIVSAVESSVFPIPPDIMLIPMCIADRSKSFLYATICTVSSVMGGIAGYAIGYFLYETIGIKVIDFYGMADKYAHLQETYQAYGGWIILAKGMTPFPFKILTILSGAMHMNLVVFICSSIIARAMRFYLVAALIWKYGAPIQVFIEKYLGWLTFLFLILLIGGFAALRYLV